MPAEWVVWETALRDARVVSDICLSLRQQLFSPCEIPIFSNHPAEMSACPFLLPLSMDA